MPDVKHTHLKVGGGKETHDGHDATAGHKHDGLMALPKWAAKVSAAEPVAFSIIQGQPVKGAETLIPYLKTATYHFSDHGDIPVEPSDLLSIKQHFDSHVRGDDLPIIDIDHMSPHLAKAAIGWVTQLVPNDAENPTELKAQVKWTEEGEKLIDADAYRYTSPNMLRHWQDPITGIEYPLIAAGVDSHSRQKYNDSAALAVTNFPRMRNLGRIAAAEDGSQCVITAVSDSPPTGDDPVRAYRLAMAEDPVTGAMDLAPCRWSPAMTDYNPCQGFTRALDDGDGDDPGDLAGCCKLAALGCNGYAPVLGTMSPLAPLGMSENKERRQMPDEVKPGTATDATAEAATKAKADKAAADEAENQRIKAAESRSTDERLRAAEARAAAAEQRAEQVAEQLRMSEQGARIGKTGDRLNALRDSGRITPAEHEKFMEAEALARLSMSESSFVLEALEARPAAAASAPYLRVQGSEAHNEGGIDEGVAMAKRTQEIVKEHAEKGEKISMSEAGKIAGREIAPTGKGGR